MKADKPCAQSPDENLDANSLNQGQVGNAIDNESDELLITDY